MTTLVLLAFAFVFALLAAFFQETYGRVNLGWLAVMFLVASMLWGRVGF